MELRTLKVGPEKANCYLVSLEDGVGFLVDPGGDPDLVITELRFLGISDLKYILMTHGHFDHILGVDGVKEAYPKATVILGDGDQKLYQMVLEQEFFSGDFGYGQPKSEITVVSDGAYLPLMDENIKVIATPGHTPGSVCYLYNDLLFSGDTLFWHAVGRTDLPYSSEHDLDLSLHRLMELPEDIFVFSGHGRRTHIGAEKAYLGIG